MITGYPVMMVMVIIAIMEMQATLFAEMKREDVAIFCVACIRRTEIMK
jgi:hypothetical protein